MLQTPDYGTPDSCKVLNDSEDPHLIEVVPEAPS